MSFIINTYFYYSFFSYNDWWQAKNLRTKQVGYVPANYISAINDLTACE